jgi:hypothetical protein
MRYTVVWVPSALNELARIWIGTSDQQAVADAADLIDKVLRTSPERVGVDWGGERYVEVEPLAVVFTVDPGDCLVRVLEVWLLP